MSDILCIFLFAISNVLENTHSFGKNRFSIPSVSVNFRRQIARGFSDKSYRFVLLFLLFLPEEIIEENRSSCSRWLWLALERAISFILRVKILRFVIITQKFINFHTHLFVLVQFYHLVCLVVYLFDLRRLTLWRS